MFRTSFIIVISLLLSACVTSNPPRKPLLVSLPIAVSENNNNLRVNISHKLPPQSLLGGSDGLQNIQFQNIFPWLKSHLTSVSHLNCQLKHKTAAEVTLRKLYVDINSETLVGNVGLTAKFGRHPATFYQGECVAGFFWIDRTKTLKNCMDSALSQITNKMRADICRNVA